MKTSASKNANARARRKLERSLYRGIREADEKNPIPLVVLSQEQAEAISTISLEVKLMRASKSSRETFIRLRWEIVRQGSDFSDDICGAIIVHVGSLFDERIEGHELIKACNIVICGASSCKEAKGVLAVWNRRNATNLDVFDLLRLHDVFRVKNSIYTGLTDQHFRSRGQNFGYGAKACYDSTVQNPADSSVTQYVYNDMNCRTMLNLHEEQKRYAIACIEQACLSIDELFRGCRGQRVTRAGTAVSLALTKSAHKTSSKLKPLIHRMGDTNYTSVFLNYNAETLDDHSEPDTTMTMIHVPPQELPSPCDSLNFTTFNFYLDGRPSTPDRVVNVHLRDGMSVFFSGFFLVHRQERHGKMHNLINASAYGNKRLYSNTKCTINRNRREGQVDRPQSLLKSVKQRPIASRRSRRIASRKYNYLPLREAKKKCCRSSAMASKNVTRTGRPIRKPIRFREDIM